METKGNTNTNTAAPARGNDRGQGGRGPRGGRGPSRFSKERVKPEYDQKMVDIKRVARVVAGGRRFNFWVTLVIGNRKGKVGVGIGKAGDTSLAINKAMNDAKKHLIQVKLNKNSSIRHQIEAKYGSSQIMIKPAPGKGIVAGSSLRTVLDLAGIKDVNAKILSRSKNKLNIARAALDALKTL